MKINKHQPDPFGPPSLRASTRERIGAPSGKSYYGADLLGSVSNGHVTFNMKYGAAFLGNGSSVKYFLINQQQ